MQAGYYRFPTIQKNTVVFANEDDLWTVSSDGGIARRLTSGLAEATRPALSPDGKWLAFTGREEGQPEIYLMPALGGPARRLTFMGGSQCWTLGWTAEGRILFTNNAKQPFGSMLYLHTVDTEDGRVEQINYGPARAISFGPGRAKVIGRNTGSPARWKRYRGGTAGQIWIDRKGNDDFQPLIELEGNLASPIWLGDRIYFLSDHEGIGNLYSCMPDGADLNRHSDRETYYARNAHSDGKRIIYHAGADLFVFDSAENSEKKIEVELHSPQTQRNRKFVEAASYLDSWNAHPAGHSMAITSRGKAFTFANWEGAVIQHGDTDGARYKLLHWLNDGERLIAVTDQEGEESFVLLKADGLGDPEVLVDLDIGRPLELAVNPKKDQILFGNHRYELYMMDLLTKELTFIDQGQSEPIAGFDWSPDGAWAAYSVSVSQHVSILRLWEAETNQVTTITQPVLRDIAPAFDPQGRYLYFLSYRHFDPVYDNMQFDLNFPRGMKPFLIVLREGVQSPFVATPRAPGEKPTTSDETDSKNLDNVVPESEDLVEDDDDSEKEGLSEDSKANGKEEIEQLKIDVDGIEKRIVPFPVPEGLYGQIRGITDGRVIYSRYPVEGSLKNDWLPKEPPASGTIFVYDFEELNEETLISHVGSFKLSRDAGAVIYRSGNRLRILKAGTKPDKDAGSRPGRKSGWLALRRINVSVNPFIEWRQMYREAWRLQRDHFWTPDLSQIDWLEVYERYLPLLDRVASRSEFSDLIWEMQGELGTSHSYEMGGDYRPEPRYDQGYLGADYSYDEESGRWQIVNIVQGDAWDEQADSPLNKPGVAVSEGDYLLAINGRELSRSVTPNAALVNLSNQEVSISVAKPGDDQTRSYTVKALREETSARYRQWVEANRRTVHDKSDGKIGYVHIPDMGPNGYAQFYRYYLAEVDRDTLIIDVRFNGGGHVSELILEKLVRKRLGYVVSRWENVPSPFPGESVLGPMVALTNEYAGSDGDIFSHSFKMLDLGPLIGTRTWGGVIGISPKVRLVDGTVTTQPEYAFWFRDVGWGVENYGTDPDIVIDNRPQDYINGRDAQLERAIQEIEILLSANPPAIPSLEDRPAKALPKLPSR